MRYPLCFLIGALCQLVMADPFIAVEGMESSFTVSAFENAKNKEVYDLYVYSVRELDMPWVKANNGYQLATPAGTTNAQEKKYFVYRYPGTIPASEVETISLVAYDLPSKYLVKAKFERKGEPEKAIAYPLTAYAHTNQSERHLGFAATLVETAPKSQKFYIDLVTHVSLEDVNFRHGKSWAGTANAGYSGKIERTYRLNHTVEKKAGLEIEVRAKQTDGSAFIQKFTLKEGEAGLSFAAQEKTVYPYAEANRQERADSQLHEQAMRRRLYGGHQYSAHEVAQARADYMSKYNLSGGHISLSGRWTGQVTIEGVLQGMIPTAQGPMWEGAGWGGPNGDTCVNRDQYGNQKPLRADASSGNIRIRFFDP